MKFDTGYPADSVEFCPHKDAQGIFVCGTYKLNEKTEGGHAPLRVGECIVLEQTSSDGNFKFIQRIDMPAILDMKWSSSDSYPSLAVADSEGGVRIMRWDTKEKVLSEQQRISCKPPNILCLSIDWSNRRRTNSSESLIVSNSDGSLSLLDETESGLAVSSSWHAHDHEPWIAAWDYWDTNFVYSGGDDLALKGWDLRSAYREPAFVLSRFEAGVTSIQSNPHSANLLAVGSYDSQVRIYDTRKMRVPICQADVGGGAWRVKWHPSAERKNDLLVACMHDGFKVVRFSFGALGLGNEATENDSNEKAEIVKRFNEHESLAYGVDWSHAGTNDAGTSLIASCSFYDHVLYTWRG